jgi:hypothetical protein
MAPGRVHLKMRFVSILLSRFRTVQRAYEGVTPTAEREGALPYDEATGILLVIFAGEWMGSGVALGSAWIQLHIRAWA